MVKSKHSQPFPLEVKEKSLIPSMRLWMRGVENCSVCCIFYCTSLMMMDLGVHRCALLATWRSGGVDGVVGERDNERLDPPRAVLGLDRHPGRVLQNSFQAAYHHPAETAILSMAQDISNVQII